jgi:AhpD family alkylhydroperoxidase
MLEKTDIEKIEKINSDSMFIHESFTSRGSKAYEAYLKLMTGAMKDGSLPKMYKELIAVGISAFHNCEPCIVWHIREALKKGATDAQVVEAIDVAIEMGGGPVVARSSFAFKVLEYHKTKSK